MAGPAYPTIVVPGITGTPLTDTYPMPPDTVWSLLNQAHERVGMHPDDLRYEALEPARIVPGQPYQAGYGELINELRFNLRAREDQPTPVYAFGYDWRQPLDAVEAQLADFIDEVIDRTRLLRHYDRAGFAADPKVNLVGHSMGGLIIAGYLQRRGAGARVHKVATLATPFRGSFEAVIKVTTGTADLGVAAPSSREREAARLTPALYHLLPSFEEGLEFDAGLPRTLFAPEVWQPSIIATIEEYVRRHGLERSDPPARAAGLFSGMLQAALDHRVRINALKLEDCGLTPGSWLCVAGAGSRTRVRLKVIRRGRGTEFVFRSDDRANDWDEDPGLRTLYTGDGTVPLAGAIPPFLRPENVIVVTPDDYGYWEVQDRMVSAMAGFHAILPNMDMLHRLIVAHFAGRPVKYENAWGRSLPGVGRVEWPVAGMRERGRG